MVILVSGVVAISANGLQIPEEGEIEALNLKFKQMYNRSTELEHSTKNPFFGYVLLAVRASQIKVKCQKK